MTPSPLHKPARPSFDPVDEEIYGDTVRFMENSYERAYSNYKLMLADGIASEVARAVLPFAVYFSGWVTCNPRSLMAFLSLRTHEPDATFVSYPQAEIEEAARAAERALEAGWPLTYRAFNEFGRVGP